MIQKNIAQNNLVLYLIMLIGLAAGFMYHSQGSGPTVVPPPSHEGAETLRLLQDLKINYGMLEDASYRALRVYGEVPVVPGPTGKFNPFGP